MDWPLGRIWGKTKGLWYWRENYYAQKNTRIFCFYPGLIKLRREKNDEEKAPRQKMAAAESWAGKKVLMRGFFSGLVNL